MSMHVHPDDIRDRFSRAMSAMYRDEVPQYGALCQLVAEVNAEALERDPARRARLEADHQLGRLDVERHGAVRLGTAAELSTLRRLFAVMGMQPVGYYDLSVAGVPVHATAFRPIDGRSLERNPFRVFTSLLRLELIADPALRDEATRILERRRIFTPGCLEAIERAEIQGGLDSEEAGRFVTEALETFRWHADATVDLATYRKLRAAHPLVADIVCFMGPHINHLTPRTLDIDVAQSRMPATGIRAKETIEGPPSRAVPILLRQTSFLALEEKIAFSGDDGAGGTHTARFGEVEQRGCALTLEGRVLYDALLARAQVAIRAGTPATDAMQSAFAEFPDDETALHRAGLAFFAYDPVTDSVPESIQPKQMSAQALVDAGLLRLRAITYEDFLPVSAAGIFRSNLGGDAQTAYDSAGQRHAFEASLGAPVQDEIALYEALSKASLEQARAALTSVGLIQAVT